MKSSYLTQNHQPSKVACFVNRTLLLVVIAVCILSQDPERAYPKMVWALSVGQFQIDTIVGDPNQIATDEDKNTTSNEFPSNDNCIYHQQCMRDESDFDSEFCLSFDHGLEPQE